jgi:putative transposase
MIPTDAPRPTYASQCQALTPAKTDHPPLKVPHSQVLQPTLRCLETAWVDMYRREFVFPKAQETCIEGKQIDLPKIGKVCAELCRSIQFFKSRSLR